MVQIEPTGNQSTTSSLQALSRTYSFRNNQELKEKSGNIKFQLWNKHIFHINLKVQKILQICKQESLLCFYTK